MRSFQTLGTCWWTTSVVALAHVICDNREHQQVAARVDQARCWAAA